LVRPNVLPANWQSYAEKLERTPRIKDANNNRLIANYAIHLYMDVGCAKVFDRFFVAEQLSVPCILGTEFMDNHVDAIVTRLKKVVWKDHVGGVSRNLKRTPILATLLANTWERSWEDHPAKVRACRQVRVKGRMEEWVMATCATARLVTISPNIRLYRHKSVAVARGVAMVKPDEPFLVKVCNFGPDQAIVRKISILGFAEPFQGPMLAAIPDEKANQTHQPVRIHRRPTTLSRMWTLAKHRSTCISKSETCYARIPRCGTVPLVLYMPLSMRL